MRLIDPKLRNEIYDSIIGTENTCPHCSRNYSKSDWGDGGSHDFRISKDTFWEGIKIKFCPFCGKNLTEDENEKR